LVLNHTRKAGYTEQAAILSEHIKALKGELKNLESKDVMQNEWLERFKKHRNINSLNRQLVTQFIDVIYVHENRRITLRFKFQDEFEKIIALMEQQVEADSLKAAV